MNYRGINVNNWVYAMDFINITLNRVLYINYQCKHLLCPPDQNCNNNNLSMQPHNRWVPRVNAWLFTLIHENTVLNVCQNRLRWNGLVLWLVRGRNAEIENRVNLQISTTFLTCKSLICRYSHSITVQTHNFAVIFNILYYDQGFWNVCWNAARFLCFFKKEKPPFVGSRLQTNKMDQYFTREWWFCHMLQYHVSAHVQNHWLWCSWILKHSDSIE